MTENWFTKETATKMRDTHAKVLQIKKDELNTTYHKLAELNKEIELYTKLLADDDKRIATMETEDDQS